MDLCFPSGIFPSKKSTNIFSGSGKQGLIPRQENPKRRITPSSGSFFVLRKRRTKQCLAIGRDGYLLQKYPGQPKEVGRRKGQVSSIRTSGKIGNPDHSDICILDIGQQEKNAGNRGKALYKNRTGKN